MLSVFDYGSGRPTSFLGRHWRSLAIVVSIAGLLIGLAFAGLSSLINVAPRHTTFNVFNQTGAPVINFTLTGPDGTYPFGNVAPRASAASSTSQSTAFKTPYTYTFMSGSKTFTGTAVYWGDDDDRGPWKAYDLSVKEIRGQLVVTHSGSGGW